MKIIFLRYKVILAGIIALTIIFIVCAVAFANYLLRAMAHCDERGLVAITFSDGSSFTCIPGNQIPPTRPERIKK